MKKLLAFLILCMTSGVSIGKSVLDSIGVETSYLLIALIAVTTAGLLMYRHMLLILLVVGLAGAVNLPVEFLAGYGVDKSILLSVLVAIILLPSVQKVSNAYL